MHFTKALSILNNALQVIARRITVLLTCMSFAVWYVSLTQILPQHLCNAGKCGCTLGCAATPQLWFCPSAQGRITFVSCRSIARTTESTESFNPIICQQNFETITLQFIRGLYQDPCAPRLQLLKAGVDTAGIEIVVCCTDANDGVLNANPVDMHYNVAPASNIGVAFIGWTLTLFIHI